MNNFVLHRVELMLCLAVAFALGSCVTGKIVRRYEVFPLRQRACWWEEKARGDSTLAVLRDRPDCRAILLQQ